MAITRGQMQRQLRRGGGIMNITPREQFGIGSSLKKFVRKVIPNEVSKVATVAAPFVAPFNPQLAAAMAGIGAGLATYVQTGGSGSKALLSGLTAGMGTKALGTQAQTGGEDVYYKSVDFVALDVFVVFSAGR